MIIKFAAYLIISLLLCEFLALSAVAWSFYESATSSLNLLKYTSDNKARDILSTIARVAETRMDPNGFQEMDDFFYRLVKQSEKDLDKFTLQEIFLISKKGVVLSHSNPDEIAKPFSFRKPSKKYQKPFFLRAHRMRKGQVPIPQNFGRTYRGDGSFFSNLFLKYFPEIENQTVIVSAPVYHKDRLETTGSVHMVYNRGNFLFFLTRQKDIFIWMAVNYIVIGAIFAILVWVFHIIFTFLGLKEGIKQLHSESEYEPSFTAKNFIKNPSATITAILKSEVFHSDINTNPRLEAPKPAQEIPATDSVTTAAPAVSDVDTVANKTIVEELSLDLEEQEDLFSMPDFDNPSTSVASTAFALPDDEEQEDFPTKTQQEKPQEVDNQPRSKEVLDAIYLD